MRFKRHASAKAEQHTKRFLLLNDALKKLVELEIATTLNGCYAYSKEFACTVTSILSSPPNKLKQVKLAHEVGRKLIPELIALATTQPTRRDIENMIVAFVCLKTHIEKQNIRVDKKLIPDLAYAVWYLNDHEPTLEEVEEWT